MVYLLVSFDEVSVMQMKEKYLSKQIKEIDKTCIFSFPYKIIYIQRGNDLV